MNFIDAYKLYSSGNEAPPIYHDWAALSVLSAFCGRRVWTSQGFFTVYPNLYVLFVGNPGNGKSTAMQIAKKMVKNFPKQSPICPASITREALTKDLGEDKSPNQIKFTKDGKEHIYTHLNIFANELVTLLGNNPIGMVEFLTDIYDEPGDFKVKTKNKGTDMIPAPYITLCGCMTPETTSSLLKQSIISGGFARRCIFVYASRRGAPVPRPQLTQEQIEAEEFCINFAKKLVYVTGEFVWSKEAEKVFDEWYVENYHEIQNSTDILLNGYFTSKNVIVIKMAMLFALVDDLRKTLLPSDITRALSMLSKTEKYLNRVFDGSGRNPEASIASKIINIIDARGKPIMKKALIGQLYSHGNHQEIDAAISHLVEQGQLESYTYQPRPGQPNITVIGTSQTVRQFAESLTGARGGDQRVREQLESLNLDLSGVDPPLQLSQDHLSREPGPSEL